MHTHTHQPIHTFPLSHTRIHTHAHAQDKITGQKITGLIIHLIVSGRRIAKLQRQLIFTTRERCTKQAFSSRYVFVFYVLCFHLFFGSLCFGNCDGASVAADFYNRVTLHKTDIQESVDFFVLCFCGLIFFLVHSVPRCTTQAFRSH